MRRLNGDWGSLVCMTVLTEREGTTCPERPYWLDTRIRSTIDEYIYEFNRFLEFALLFFRCKCELQLVRFINKPACRTVSASAGSPDLMKQSY